MTARSLVVVHAGLREPSSTAMLGSRLADATVRALADAGVPVVVTTVALREYSGDIMAALTSFASARLEEVFDAVAAADGIIAVTPLFNTSYSGLFKSFFDALPAEVLRGKPLLMAATGGTPRHSLALDYAMRPMFAYLHAAVLSTGVFAATSDWGAGAEEVRPLPARIELAGGELAGAMVARPPSPPRDGLAATDFGEVLRQLGQ